MERTAYPGDVSDEEWVFVAAYLMLTREDARDYERLPEILAGLHFVAFASLSLARFVRVAHEIRPIRAT